MDTMKVVFALGVAIIVIQHPIISLIIGGLLLSSFKSNG